jgi:hypothetical protein
LNTGLVDYSVHTATSTCSGTVPAGTVIGMAATKDDGGYWIANDQGLVLACGDATNFGGLTSTLNAPIVGIAATPDGGGYYLVASDGGIFTFGDAVFQGSTGAHRLNKPVVGMAVDPNTGGYWLVASDGGIFSFNAPFHGSTGSMALNEPIVGMTADAVTGGYWLVASDGGIFAFSAPFNGSMGSVPLNKPIVGMASDDATGGYWLVAADGGIFSFDDVPFDGSTGDVVLNRPIVGMEANGTGTGYRFVASDGGVFDFGSSAFFGSPVPSVSTLPDTAPTTTTTTIATQPPTTTPTTTQLPTTTTTTGPPSTTTTTTSPPPTTTTTTTTPPSKGTLVVTLTYGSALGCSPPMTPGCPEFVTINGSGWTPNKTYDLTITGPNLTGNSGQTTQTDSDGDIYISQATSGGGLPEQTNAVTSLPPTPGTYSVTMGGVTASYTYDPPATVSVWLFGGPDCTGATGICSFNIEFLATGFPPDDTLPVSVMWNGNVVNQTIMTTDDTGSIWLVDGGATPVLPYEDGNLPAGTATVTVGNVTG